jgi:hypothetical protein
MSLQDINRLYNDEDTRSFKMMLREAQKQNEIKRLQQKLDIAEAFNHAYVGSRYDKKGENKRSFSRWLNSLESAIAKLKGQKILTVFDTIKKSRKL